MAIRMLTDFNQRPVLTANRRTTSEQDRLRQCQVKYTHDLNQGQHGSSQANLEAKRRLEREDTGHDIANQQQDLGGEPVMYEGHPTGHQQQANGGTEQEGIVDMGNPAQRRVTPTWLPYCVHKQPRDEQGNRQVSRGHVNMLKNDVTAQRCTPLYLFSSDLSVTERVLKQKIHI